jgi:hypothetical protein
MADLFLGQSMSEFYKFISAGTAHTFEFGFQPDKVVFNNLSDWTATAAGKPVSIWWRDQTTAAHAFQNQVIDSSAGASFNFLDTATNGFTVADTDGGAVAYRALISGVTLANPCVVTTTAAHGFQTDQVVRLSDLGSDMPTPRGMNQINNKRFRIVVLTSTTFSLKDVISDDPINSTSYTAWVAGGRVNLESRVLALNNPQVSPYSPASPYGQTPFVYDPISYQLTVGTNVMGSDGDIFNIEVYKFGQVIDLGDLLV